MQAYQLPASAAQNLVSGLESPGKARYFVGSTPIEVSRHSRGIRLLSPTDSCEIGVSNFAGLSALRIAENTSHLTGFGFTRTPSSLTAVPGAVCALGRCGIVPSGSTLSLSGVNIQENRVSTNYIVAHTRGHEFVGASLAVIYNGRFSELGNQYLAIGIKSAENVTLADGSRPSTSLVVSHDTSTGASKIEVSFPQSNDGRISLVTRSVTKIGDSTNWFSSRSNGDVAFVFGVLNTVAGRAFDTSATLPSVLETLIAKLHEPDKMGGALFSPLGTVIHKLRCPA